MSNPGHIRAAVIDALTDLLVPEADEILDLGQLIKVVGAVAGRNHGVRVPMDVLVQVLKDVGLKVETDPGGREGRAYGVRIKGQHTRAEREAFAARRALRDEIRSLSRPRRTRR
ncbi:hypothetical protein [Streptomyces sp. AA1529]|uniref:hypothetical protein n=1 Tax=Streptomyces sp. AA1529 TaxID=1203257 RepID=UPI0003705C8D|nr:hypothetical protein [Streptomyces sp. AA1529]